MKALIFGVFDGDAIYSAAAFGKSPQDAAAYTRAFRVIFDAHFTAILPAEKSPTISSLADADWVAVEVIVSERIERDLVPQLKRAGATGIITYPLNKVIP